MFSVYQLTPKELFLADMADTDRVEQHLPSKNYDCSACQRLTGGGDIGGWCSRPCWLLRHRYGARPCRTGAGSEVAWPSYVAHETGPRGCSKDFAAGSFSIKSSTISARLLRRLGGGGHGIPSPASRSTCAVKFFSQRDAGWGCLRARVRTAGRLLGVQRPRRSRRSNTSVLLVPAA